MDTTIIPPSRIAGQAALQATPETIDTSIPLPSFRTWLEHCHDEAPAAENLVFLIAQSLAGNSRAGLANAVGLPPETLEDLLRAFLATGQVVALKVNGQRVYRAAG